MKGEDAVERLGRPRQRGDAIVQSAIGDVCAQKMDLLLGSTLRMHSEARAVKLLRDVNVKEALHSIYSNAEPSANRPLRISD